MSFFLLIRKGSSQWAIIERGTCKWQSRETCRKSLLRSGTMANGEARCKSVIKCITSWTLTELLCFDVTREKKCWRINSHDTPIPSQRLLRHAAGGWWKEWNYVNFDFGFGFSNFTLLLASNESLVVMTVMQDSRTHLYFHLVEWPKGLLARARKTSLSPCLSRFVVIGHRGFWFGSRPVLLRRTCSSLRRIADSWSAMSSISISSSSDL